MTPGAKPELSIVIPVYRSEDILPKLAKRLDASLCALDIPYEIVLVNDCSPDGSWARILEISRRYPHFKAVSLRRNSGYDNALMAGLGHASGEYVVTMDDDLQHAPEDIPALLNEIKKGHDIVYAEFQTKKQSFIKNIGSWFNGKLAEIIISKPKDIYLSPFKIIRKAIVAELISYCGPYPYIDGLLFQKTASIAQIPIGHFSRDQGEGNHGIFRSLRIMANFCTTFSITPLRMATYLGFFITLAAAIFSMILIAMKLYGAIDIEGWASTLLTILFMGGVQLLSLGIIGEYIGRIYMNINRQSQFVVKEKINLD